MTIATAEMIKSVRRGVVYPEVVAEIALRTAQERVTKQTGKNNARELPKCLFPIHT